MPFGCDLDVSLQKKKNKSFSQIFYQRVTFISLRMKKTSKMNIGSASVRLPFHENFNTPSWPIEPNVCIEPLLSVCLFSQNGFYNRHRCSVLSPIVLIVNAIAPYSSQFSGASQRQVSGSVHRLPFKRSCVAMTLHSGLGCWITAI